MSAGYQEETRRVYANMATPIAKAARFDDRPWLAFIVNEMGDVKWSEPGLPSHATAAEALAAAVRHCRPFG